jgi:hypothetical protein
MGKWSGTMRTVEIRVPQASLADILNSMREWLDRERCNLSHFRHTSGDDGIIVIAPASLTLMIPASMHFISSSAEQANSTGN